MPSNAAPQVFAVRSAVVALLQARAALSAVKVTYGWPGDDNIERQMIYTDARGRGSLDVAGLRNGRTHYNEDGEFDVTVRVEAVGGTQESADETCAALCLEFAETIADNRTLSDLVAWVKLARWENGSGYNDRGYLALVTFTCAYRARLT